MAHLLIFTILPLCSALGIAFWVVERLGPATATRVALVMQRPLWVGLGGLLSLLYVLCVGFSAYLPVVIDAVESTVASTAGLWQRGNPLYTTIHAGSRYSLLYGPLCYVPYTLSLSWFGGGVLTLKLVMVGLNVALLVVLWLVFRAMLGGVEALVPMGFILAGLMMKGMSTFMIRGDVTLALAIALAFLAVHQKQKWFAATLFVLAGTVALDIKFTGVLYLLVPFHALWQRYRRWLALVAAGAVPVVGLAPFALSSVSLRNYLGWISQASKHPLALKLFAMNVVAGAILVVPVVLMLVQYLRVEPELARDFLRTQRLLFVCWRVSPGAS